MKRPNIMQMLYVVKMNDDSRWGVPVQVIAEHRAKNYADEFEGDVARSLAEDITPLFEHDNSEITDWAHNNMDWTDVKGHAIRLETPAKEVEWEEGWMNGAHEFIDKPLETNPNPVSKPKEVLSILNDQCPLCHNPISSRGGIYLRIVAGECVEVFGCMCDKRTTDVFLALQEYIRGITKEIDELARMSKPNTRKAEG